MTVSPWRGTLLFGTRFISTRPTRRWLRRRGGRPGAAGRGPGPDLPTEVVDVRGLSVELFAHDLRSPLLASRRAVMEMLDRTRRPAADVAALDEDLLRALDRSLERVDQLMGDILELASLSARGVTHQTCLARELVEETYQQCSAPERVRCWVPADLAVEANGTLLVRAMLNLVENALRYSDGRIEMKLRRAAEGLLIVVDDDGEGVPAPLRDVIFEPLARAAPEGSTGAGLGLALVRRVAEVHGGLAGVEAAPTGGARFVLWIPNAGTLRPLDAEPSRRRASVRR